MLPANVSNRVLVAHSVALFPPSSWHIPFYPSRQRLRRFGACSNDATKRNPRAFLLPDVGDPAGIMACGILSALMLVNRLRDTIMRDADSPETDGGMSSTARFIWNHESKNPRRLMPTAQNL
jgi:hypothetical protein